MYGAAAFWTFNLIALLLAILVLVSATQLIRFYLNKNHAARSTPYQANAFQGGARSRPFDVFISYKAEDANIAREIADWLLAVGRTPWFDEYVIARLPETDVQNAIQTAPKKCEFGIVIATDEYAKAHFTRLELRALVTHVRHEHLFSLYSRDWHTRLPTDDQLLGDILLAVPNKARYEDSLEPVYAWLQEHLNIKGPNTAKKREAGPRFALSEYWEVSLGSWKHLNTYLPGEIAQFGDVKVPIDERSDFFELTLPTHSAYLNVIQGPAPPTWRRDFGKGEFVEKRTLQTQMKAIAELFLRDEAVPSGFDGAHLYYLDEQPPIPQIGFTYWNERWVRRVSVVLESATGVAEEFAFVFSVDGGFRDLCRISSHIDCLVRSTRRRIGHRPAAESGSQVFTAPDGVQIEVVKLSEEATLVCPKCGFELDIYKGTSPRRRTCLGCGHSWTE
jgi:hypothetical protein